jgi:hypothetical protein
MGKVRVTLIGRNSPGHGFYILYVVNKLDKDLQTMQRITLSDYVQEIVRLSANARDC